MDHVKSIHFTKQNYSNGCICYHISQFYLRSPNVDSKEFTVILSAYIYSFVCNKPNRNNCFLLKVFLPSCCRFLNWNCSLVVISLSTLLFLKIEYNNKCNKQYKFNEWTREKRHHLYQLNYWKNHFSLYSLSYLFIYYFLCILLIRCKNFEFKSRKSSHSLIINSFYSL